MPLFRYPLGDDAPHYDVAIIGAGAAGITLARKLGAQGVRTALLEGGKYDYTEESQSIYNTEIIGHPYTLVGTRYRYFGGSTNFWGGYVVQLDADTFEPRTDLYAAYPGWPIRKAELDPYQPEALTILDLPPNAPFAPERNRFERFDERVRDVELQELYWNQSPPTRFRTKYFEEVSTAYPSVDVLLDHSLVDLESDADGTISAAVFTNIESDTTYRITARRFVLACGAVENARLLMYFNEKNGTSYGNTSGMLGKFFMEHPELDAAQFVMTDPNYQHRVNNHAYRFFRPARAWQLREGLAGCILRLSFTYEGESDEIIQQLEAATTLQRQAWWRAGYIMMSFEQLPVESNHITLDANTPDRLGMPHAVLHWRLLPEDYHTPRVVLRRFANMMLEQNFGRVRYFDWILDDNSRPDPLWAKHHIGTTRMATNEREGVTDTDGLLFGTKNFYLAGASVFPTAGYENPTLPVVQMSLRLSDHLLSIMNT